MKKTVKNPPVKEAKPIIIQVKNNTDEKFHDVKIIDFKYIENKNLEYFYIMPGITYEQFLKMLQAYNNKTTPFFFKKVNIEALCDYKKFEDKQQRSVLSSVHWEPAGVTFTNHKVPKINHNEQISIYDFDQNMPLSFFSTLVLQYLMPETTVHVELYV